MFCFKTTKSTMVIGKMAGSMAKVFRQILYFISDMKGNSKMARSMAKVWKHNEAVLYMKVISKKTGSMVKAH